MEKVCLNNFIYGEQEYMYINVDKIKANAKKTCMCVCFSGFCFQCRELMKFQMFGRWNGLRKGRTESRSGEIVAERVETHCGCYWYTSSLENL